MPVPEDLLKRRAELDQIVEQHRRSIAIAQRELDMRGAELATLNFAIAAIEAQPADVRARTRGPRRNLRQIVLDDIAAHPMPSSVEELVERTGLRVKAVRSALSYWLSKDKIEPVSGRPDSYRLMAAGATASEQRIEE